MEEIKRHLGMLLAFVFLAGCTSAPLMQERFFSQVVPGVSISGIEGIYGEPYEVRELPNGLQEYVYVQRIELGNNAVEQMEFVFVVDRGVVLGKDCRRHGTSAFQFVQ